MPETDADRPPSPRGTSPICVLVVGAPGSGVDAIGAALGELGCQVAGSGALNAISEDAVRALGSTWDTPPWPATVADDPRLATWLSRARSLLQVLSDEAVASEKPAFSWADPLAPLLLPFWRGAAGDHRLATVLVTRAPLDFAAGLAGAGRGIAPTLALALWEHYHRSALSGLVGLPVLVTSCATARADPASWVSAVRGILELPCTEHATTAVSAVEAALALDAEPVEPVEPVQPVEAGEGGGKDESLLLASQLQLAALLDRLEGPHECFDPPIPEPPSPWVTALLEGRRDLTQVWQGLDWATAQLARFTSTAGLGSGPEPGSQAERYLPNATADLDDYHRWLVERGEPTRLPLGGGLPAVRPPVRPKRAPLFSVVVPVCRPPAWALERCMASVLGQLLVDFQLVLADDASGDTALEGQLRSLARLDPRVKVLFRSEHGGSAAATNSALSCATGEFVAFVDDTDELHPLALERLAGAIALHPRADVLYSDEDELDAFGTRRAPTMKPGWSPDLLLSFGYLRHVLVVRRSLVESVGGLRPGLDEGERYDLMLRSTEQAREVVHVPEVLYHRRMVAGAAPEAATVEPGPPAPDQLAVEDALRRRGIDAVVEPDAHGAGYRNLRRAIAGRPLVSVIIPFRDRPRLTAECYRSAVRSPGYDNFELLLVDNDSELPETQALLDELSGDPRVRIVPAPGGFDYAAINNRAVAEARGDVLLFLNNDIEVRSSGWLAAMVGHAQRDEVGAVGALLRYRDLTIQHAGVVLGMNWGVAHVQQRLPYGRASYLHLVEATRNCSAVTGACLMTRRSVFEACGGFDLALPISFNDIDYCLRLREQGLLVVYTPLAELIHLESESRGHTDDVIEVPFFLERWKDAILEGDPYYNPHLNRFDPYCRLSSEEDRNRWSIFRSMLEASSNS